MIICKILIFPDKLISTLMFEQMPENLLGIKIYILRMRREITTQNVLVQCWCCKFGEKPAIQQFWRCDRPNSNKGVLKLYITRKEKGKANPPLPHQETPTCSLKSYLFCCEVILCCYNLNFCRWIYKMFLTLCAVPLESIKMNV